MGKQYPEYKRAWRARNRERQRAYWKKYYANRPGLARAKHLQLRYGITPEIYDVLVKSQQGRCAICKEERTLVVDHDHQIHKVRALLCHNCNKGIGHFADDPYLLHEASRYVYVWASLRDLSTSSWTLRSSTGKNGENENHKDTRSADLVILPWIGGA